MKGILNFSMSARTRIPKPQSRMRVIHKYKLTISFDSFRFNRNGSPPSTGGIHSISSLLTIPPLYHYPHPNLPVFTSMGFEVLFLSYLVSALVLQHINIYKTVGAFLILAKLYSGRNINESALF